MKTFFALAAVVLAPFCHASGWVHWDSFPYIYDHDSNGWLYSSTTGIWVYEYSSAEWSVIGNIPERYAPENVADMTITICERGSCWEAHYHGYHFAQENEAEHFAWIEMLGGFVPEDTYDVRYEYEFIGNNKAVISFFPVEEGRNVENLVLTFTSPNEGHFTGSLFGYNDFGTFVTDQWTGTFVISDSGMEFPSQ